MDVLMMLSCSLAYFPLLKLYRPIEAQFTLNPKPKALQSVKKYIQNEWDPNYIASQSQYACKMNPLIAAGISQA